MMLIRPNADGTRALRVVTRLLPAFRREHAWPFSVRGRGDEQLALDGFTEVGELGSGAQQRVVLARPDGVRWPDRPPYLAIKYVTGTGNRHSTGDDARLMAAVDDAHVARVYELVERPDGVALVMEAVYSCAKG